VKNSNFYILSGALWGLLSVALGAVGTHVLKSILSTTQMEWIHTGVQYQIFHSLVLVSIGSWSLNSRLKAWTAVFFNIGILLFSVSLYLLAFTGNKVFAWFTPFGGISLISAWILLVLCAYRGK